MLHEKQIGRNGMKPETSAISGRALSPEDAYIGINGYWVGVKAREWAASTPAEQQALKAEWADSLPSGKAGNVPESELPEYDLMGMDELKALASERGVDITGRRSKEDVRQALRVADVSARFAEPAAETDTGTPLDLSAAVGE